MANDTLGPGNKFKFACEACQGEVLEKNSERTNETGSAAERFHDHLPSIRDALQKSEAMMSMLPPYVISLVECACM